MIDLTKVHVIFMVETNPESGLILKMTPIAYAPEESYAKMITNMLNTQRTDPNIVYKFGLL